RTWCKVSGGQRGVHSARASLSLRPHWVSSTYPPAPTRPSPPSSQGPMDERRCGSVREAGGSSVGSAWTTGLGGGGGSVSNTSTGGAAAAVAFFASPSLAS